MTAECNNVFYVMAIAITSIIAIVLFLVESVLLAKYREQSKKMKEKGRGLNEGDASRKEVDSLGRKGIGSVGRSGLTGSESVPVSSTNSSAPPSNTGGKKVMKNFKISTIKEGGHQIK
uniref:Col_cuticle_N domain-containing protein n=1 Tax=Rhabditophanes sp. KR3021 TaxID=114890 RepID=A0AC35UEV0_9BILA